MNKEEFFKLADEIEEEQRAKEDNPYMRLYIKVMKDVGIDCAVLYGYYVSMVDLSAKTNLLYKSEKKEEKYKDEFGTFCCCSYENIEEYTGFKKTKASELKKKLIKNGYIKEVRRKDKSNKTYILK